MTSASDLWTAGVQLADLRGKDGSLDQAKIKEAQEARDRVLAEHPHWRQAPIDFGGGVREPAPEAGPSFGSALKRAAGR
jgi:hypothetical protein